MSELIIKLNEEIDSNRRGLLEARQRLRHAEQEIAAMLNGINRRKREIYKLIKADP